VSVVLDTTVVIDMLRGYPEARGLYRGLDAPPICSEVTRIEVLAGMRPHEQTRTRQMLATLGWHPVDGRVAELAGNWRRQFLASHRLDVPDLCVAATAEVLGLPLVTSNIKHFPMFPGLTAPY
jgi:predicted nucleic acid-binding protein